MESSAAGLLVGSEIHGFHTMHDLDVGNMMEEAKMRWLRPNEIHAILCNSKYFTINAKPITLPKSGTVVLFDRKMLRNFRRDGHNWKKKKDGKTVKEAHEHLKVGNNERIHVYYAHGQDNSTFVRRCYWLLDKKLEHIVLVHYRETQEVSLIVHDHFHNGGSVLPLMQGSPPAPLSSNSNSSSVSDPSAPWHLSEELDSGANRAHYFLTNGPAVSTEPGDNLTVKNHEIKLHELNTLEWDQLVTEDVSTEDNSNFTQQNMSEAAFVYDSGLSNRADSPGTSVEPLSTMGAYMNPNTSNLIDFSNIDGLEGQDSLGKWMNYIITENHFPNSVEDFQVTSSHSSGYYASSPLTMLVDNQELSSLPESVFRITDVAPAWAYSTEKTKILIAGFFDERHLQQEKSNLFCVCGDLSVPVEVVQGGGFRCLVPPHRPGLVGLYLSFDGHKPISQVIDFEYRAPMRELVLPTEEKPKWEELQLQMRLAFLLFSTSKCLDIASSSISLNEQKDGKKFAIHTANISKDWAYFLSSVEENRTSFLQAKETAFELMLKNRLKDWILERVITGCKISEFDIHGQAVIHLCAILGYTWSVQLFSWSGFSLDFRDKFGWTALHWAAYCGREKMVAKLLSVGAKANLVTDPTSENPCGSTAADLASKKGFEGLSAYLAEKGLIQHFNDMSLAGNISGSLKTTTDDELQNHENNLTEEDSYLKDSLAAYRTAADAASRIQCAFRENSLKIRTKLVQHLYEEDEARSIIAALRIQHAFRNFESKKKLAAAARIQYTFRTWRLRREFLNLRKQAIRIQAVYRGYQVRRHHHKILWSVGVVEKAILRWRLKRKGFRGMEIKSEESVDCRDEREDPEEDFFKTSRRQAEERLDRSVVRVQAMFRSKKAQEEYRRMKLAHAEAKLEYDEMHDDNKMER